MVLTLVLSRRVRVITIPLLHEDIALDKPPVKQTISAVVRVLKDLLMPRLTSLLFSECKTCRDLGLAL